VKHQTLALSLLTWTVVYYVSLPCGFSGAVRSSSVHTRHTFYVSTTYVQNSVRRREIQSFIVMAAILLLCEGTNFAGQTYLSLHSCNTDLTLRLVLSLMTRKKTVSVLIVSEMSYVRECTGVVLDDQGRNHVFKVGGPIPWSMLLYRTKYGCIPSFVHCSVLRNVNHTLHQERWGGPSKFWGSGPTRPPSGCARAFLAPVVSF